MSEEPTKQPAVGAEAIDPKDQLISDLFHVLRFAGAPVSEPLDIVSLIQWAAAVHSYGASLAAKTAFGSSALLGRTYRNKRNGRQAVLTRDEGSRLGLTHDWQMNKSGKKQRVGVTVSRFSWEREWEEVRPNSVLNKPRADK